MKRKTNGTDAESVFNTGAKTPEIGGFTPPQLFFGHRATRWLLWTIAATVAAVWIVPPVAELINRFVLKLW